MEKHPKGFFVRHFGLRGVALFEAAKGGLAVLAAAWVMTLRHKDMKEVAETLLTALHRLIHINPDRPFFQWTMRSVGGVTPHGLKVLAALILAYAVIRFAEATGLWLEKEWAEWFALISCVFYTPFLVYELARHPTGFKWFALGLNLLIVWYLAWLLRDSYRHKWRRQAALADQRREMQQERPPVNPTTAN